MTDIARIREAKERAAAQIRQTFDEQSARVRGAVPKSWPKADGVPSVVQPYIEEAKARFEPFPKPDIGGIATGAVAAVKGAVRQAPAKVLSIDETIADTKHYPLSRLLGATVKTLQITVDNDCELLIKYEGGTEYIPYPRGLDANAEFLMRGENLSITDIQVVPTVSTVIKIVYCDQDVGFQLSVVSLPAIFEAIALTLLALYAIPSQGATGVQLATIVPAQLVAAPPPVAIKSITIQNDSGNTDSIFIGFSAAVQLYKLDIGESVMFDWNDYSTLWVTANSGIQTVRFMCIL